MEARWGSYGCGWGDFIKSGKRLVVRGPLGDSVEVAGPVCLVHRY
jgi:hypothetical protein